MVSENSQKENNEQILALDQEIKLTKSAKVFSTFSLNIRNYAIIIALIVFWVIFGIATKGLFLSPRNITLLARQMAITGILASGMFTVLLIGNIDLSVGSVAAFGGAVSAILQVWYGWPTVPAVILGIVSGILIGVWQGFWIVKIKVPGFITTLGGMMIFRGLSLIIMKGITVTPLEDSFNFIGQGFLPGKVSVGAIAAGFAFYLFSIVRERIIKKKNNYEISSILRFIGRILLVSVILSLVGYVVQSYMGIPMPVVFLILIAMVLIFITRETTFGKHLYVMGGNSEAARLYGIKVKRNIFIIFVLMSSLSAFAGIILAARVNGASTTAGTLFELDAIAACVIGGASLLGGAGTIFGVIVGALIVASLDNGMSLLNISSFYQYVAKGLVLIFAVAFDIYSKERKR